MPFNIACIFTRFFILHRERNSDENVCDIILRSIYFLRRKLQSIYLK